PPQKWDAMYDGIQRANDVLRTLKAANANDMSASDTILARAQAVFLRAFYHFELVRVFKHIPFVDESVTFAANDYNVPNVDGSGNFINPMPKIEADFQYAMQYLPATWNGDKGRANKYAAEAFLAKCYMYDQNYSGAIPLLGDLMVNGETASGDRYALQKNYFNNFNADPTAKNTSESVFAAQMSVNDGSAAATNQQGNPNGNYGDALNFPYNGGPGACCGFDNPSQDLADAYKTDPATGLPLLDGSFETGGHVIARGTWAGTLDPRIDFVMGRPGIPYLDWGPHPGDAWIRDTLNDGHFNPKKNVYALSQKTTLADNSSTYWAAVELTADNVNLIRYSDVMLWMAECQVQTSGDLGTAEALVDSVRSRAANPAYWTYINNDGTAPTFNATSYSYTQKPGTTIPADNYKIGLYPTGTFAANGAAYALKAIQFERRLEFAMEGQRFFDLQRWDFGSPGSMAAVLNNYVKVTAPLRPAFIGATFVQGKSELFPIPQNQIDIENEQGKINLKQNPGY
ncbi:MAG TPA: RagB/SusD family nutrient uptake outer membrane protein, partial [Puia sp.]|nr:RagB/SusD family nutrient uptake outer membrane protein [Puia sp.]